VADLDNLTIILSNFRGSPNCLSNMSCLYFSHRSYFLEYVQQLLAFLSFISCRKSWLGEKKKATTPQHALPFSPQILQEINLVFSWTLARNCRVSNTFLPIGPKGQCRLGAQLAWTGMEIKPSSCLKANSFPPWSCFF